MKKKIAIIHLLILVIISLTSTSTYSYSTEQYNISLPSSYTQISTNTFADAQGNSINLNIKQEQADKGFKYEQKYLDKLLDGFTTNQFKQGIIKGLNDALNNCDIYLTDEELLQIYNQMDINIENASITTCTKNNYQCFYVEYTAQLNNTKSYVAQYIIISQNYSYVISISTNNKNYLKSTELKEIINSITLKNYQEIEENETIWVKMILTAIVALICGGIYNIFQKNKTIKVNQEPQKLKTNYCNYCGNQLLESDNFCISCGKKVTKNKSRKEIKNG